MNNTIFKTTALAVACTALLACGGNPDVTVAPATPDTPTVPVTPTTPVVPTTPVTPAVPVTPTTPSTPSTPTTPEVPVTPVTPPVPKLADAQGFWRANPSATSSASAVILPDGQAWVVYETATSAVSALAQVQLSLNGSAYSSVGKYFSLPAGSAAAQDYKLSGTLSVASSPALTSSVTVGNASASTVTWIFDNTYATPATQASVLGSWRGAQGSDSLSWGLDKDGKLTGTSTTGCTYSGTLKPNANPVAVLDVALSETCAGTLKALTGIATLNAAKTGLSLAYTTGTGAATQGGVVLLRK